MGRQRDDDGRVIADMSGIEKPRLFGGLPGAFRGNGTEAGRAEEKRRSQAAGGDRGHVPPGWSEHIDLDGPERRAAVRGMLKGALLIGSVYLIIFAAVIALMYFLW